MKKDIFIGVDGGATKSIIRIETPHGELLAEMLSGPANISISVEESWRSILVPLHQILADLSIDKQQHRLHAGMGVAGTELKDAYQRFIETPHIFDTLVVRSDAHIACLGAHAKEDGAIIIVGTGVVGYQKIGDDIIRVGGWGFPHDDEGGGAWLGLQAIKVALNWLDNRAEDTGLAAAIYRHFDENADHMVHWARHATPTLYATLAPIVIQQSQIGDPVATHLIHHAANTINHLGLTLIRQAEKKMRHQVPLSFIGGVAPFLMDYLSEELKDHVRPLKHSSAEGAIFMLHEHFQAAVSVQS